MDIIIFKDKTFHQIPRQDNPAFSDDDCLLICKDSDKPSMINVLEIKDQFIDDEKIEERVFHLGKFWRIKIANLFAEAYVNSIPKFKKTYCSQCGGEFGPGDHGYSHCESHKGIKRIG